MTVQRDGSVIVTAPRWAGLAAVERFVTENTRWIMRQVSRMTRRRDDKIALPSGRAEYLARKAEALALIMNRLDELNTTHYGFTYHRVSVKDQRTRWGSCSRRGNLNFSYKLLYLPAPLRDYILVHELCHLRYMSHGVRFWELVARVVPDHRERRRELRRYDLK